jgi:hypothetical protein
MTSLLPQGKRAVAFGAGGTIGSAASDRVRMRARLWTELGGNWKPFYLSPLARLRDRRTRDRPRSSLGGGAAVTRSVQPQSQTSRPAGSRPLRSMQATT